MLIEFTIKILLISFDLILFIGILLFCFFFAFDYQYYFLFTGLWILITFAFCIKILWWLIIGDTKKKSQKIDIDRRFIAIILIYIIPIYIFWNTHKLYINKEVLNIIYLLMFIFFIIEISKERKIFTLKRYEIGLK